jgi:vacuolar-type H+-ATPase subunit H
MPAEKSLLQRIREKELEISVKIDLARREAEQYIHDVKKEAVQIMTYAEKDGATVAEELYRSEMKNIGQEIEQIATRGREEASIVREKGEKNLQGVIEKIVKYVTLE